MLFRSDRGVTGSSTMFVPAWCRGYFYNAEHSLNRLRKPSSPRSEKASGAGTAQGYANDRGKVWPRIFARTYHWSRSVFAIGLKLLEVCDTLQCKGDGGYVTATHYRRGRWRRRNSVPSSSGRESNLLGPSPVPGRHLV